MPFARPCRSVALCGLLSTVMTCSTGCLITRVDWAEPVIATTNTGLLVDEETVCCPERLYTIARRQEDACSAKCVDSYFAVAVATSRHDGPASACCRLRELHKSSLTQLVITGQRFGRLDPRGALRVNYRGHQITIPIRHHGFVWRPSDFQRLVAVGPYETNALKKLHRCRGIGIPLVVTNSRRTREGTLLPYQSAFSATMVLSTECRDSHGEDLPCRIDLIDPLRKSIAVFGTKKRRKIAKDLSAPIAYRLRDERQTYLSNFIAPSSAGAAAELRVLEPYQKGKIPIVFIHGLLSDPFTWVEMINELQTYPWIVENFQFWAFQYPTGQAFLDSAASLRAQLRVARRTFDPNSQDPQLSEMVLVGHSMGGLIAKLQITDSGSNVWRSICKRPFSQVSIPDGYRQELERSFFFKASPDVSRVVFMATPHCGSGFARRMIGRCGSSLVRESDADVRAHRKLIDWNPGVFAPEVSRRIPTSIDLLDPDSPLLQAINKICIKPSVQMHSVIGDSCWSPLRGKSDGVVPVSSARHRCVVSERFIKTTHSEVNEHPEAVAELVCILCKHLEENLPRRGNETLELMEPTRSTSLKQPRLVSREPLRSGTRSRPESGRRECSLAKAEVDT